MLDANSTLEAGVVPEVIRRAGGGWLAIAPKSSGISVGVTAPTQEIAREKFRSVFSRWVEILASETKKAAS